MHHQAVSSSSTLFETNHSFRDQSQFELGSDPLRGQYKKIGTSQAQLKYQTKNGLNLKQIQIINPPFKWWLVGRPKYSSNIKGMESSEEVIYSTVLIDTRFDYIDVITDLDCSAFHSKSPISVHFTASRFVCSLQWHKRKLCRLRGLNWNVLMLKYIISISKCEKLDYFPPTEGYGDFTSPC